MALKPEDEKARKLIQEGEKRFLKGNYYEVLGIERKAAEGDVFTEPDAFTEPPEAKPPPKTTQPA